MLFKNRETALHDVFLIGIAIKGVDGALEMVGGVVLMLINSGSVAAFVQAIFRHELVEDPTDLIANYFVHASQAMSASGLSFAAIYLLIHGAIKAGLFAGLWYKKLWAYPAAGILLSFFVAYQAIRLASSHSILLLTLTLTDIVIIALLRFEYKRVKRSLK